MRKKKNPIKRLFVFICLFYIALYVLINMGLFRMTINDTNIDKYFPSITSLFKWNNNENKKYSNEHLNTLYKEIVNDIYPNESLTPIKVKWGDLTNRSASGLFLYRIGEEPVITIDYSLYDRSLVELKDVLAHEIVHYYLFSKNIEDNHGKAFKDEMRRINNLGKGYNISIIDVP